METGLSVPKVCVASVADSPSKKYEKEKEDCCPRCVLRRTNKSSLKKPDKIFPLITALELTISSAITTTNPINTTHTLGYLFCVFFSL